jgi:hypothetical protein
MGGGGCRRPSLRCLEVAFICIVLLAGGLTASGLLSISDSAVLPTAVLPAVLTVLHPPPLVDKVVAVLQTSVRNAALDAVEIARQRVILASIAARTYSREEPFEQPHGRPPVIYAADPRPIGVASADVCARGAAFFKGLPHLDDCEICDEHAHASRYLHERFLNTCQHGLVQVCI